MNGDKNEGKALPRKRREYSDDMEPVGTGPIVVINQSRKMSIYGPNFNCGPIQLRKQRLLEKMKKEAEKAMSEKMQQLADQEKQQKLLEEQKKAQQAQIEKFNDENKNRMALSLDSNNQQYQYQEYQNYQQYQEFYQYPMVEQYPPVEQYQHYDNLYANKF
ncbi:hypothetical protein GCK72_023272 [Caenorhabditis remanei]|uniref:Uncharacterized protein n=1 Tax=Caenorhabditis remanei TaxID=31234 RepID=A0A6A5FWE4_CAERE|nr:hypothetical protein GCK72_023272 [Caenorhabditis remanei]KAF1746814.1 hypothetical protein GCK72_023272 [Caenorhabditis remanei]